MPAAAAQFVRHAPAAGVVVAVVAENTVRAVMALDRVAAAGPPEDVGRSAADFVRPQCHRALLYEGKTQHLIVLGQVHAYLRIAAIHDDLGIKVRDVGKWPRLGRITLRRQTSGGNPGKAT